MEENTETTASSHGKELFLDTKGACFLCLKDTSTDADNQAITEVCLRHVCRHLQINPSVVLLKSLKGSCLNDDEKEEATSQQERCDFSVPLCEHCSLVTKKLLKLIEEKERTEMLMNHQLQKFNQILTSSQDAELNGGWEKLKEKMTAGASPIEARLVEQLRLETKEKSGAALKHARSIGHPKVRLSRLKIETSGEPLHSSGPQVKQKAVEVPTLQITNVRSIPPVSDPSRSNSPTATEDPLVDSCKLSPPSPESTSAPIWNTPKEWLKYMMTTSQRNIQSKDQYPCPFCNKLNSQGNARSHIAMIHLDRFFAQKMDIAPSHRGTFRQHVRRICRLGTEKAGTPNITCYVCNGKYSIGVGFKYHFLLQHFSIWEEKILQLKGIRLKPPQPVQPTMLTSTSNPPIKKVKTAGPRNMLQSVPPHAKQHFIAVFAKFCEEVAPTLTTNRPGTLFRCKICNVPNRVQIKQVIQKHLMVVHPQEFFSHVKDAHVSAPEFMLCCRRVLKQECKTTATAVLTRKIYSCEICGLKNENIFNLKYHLMVRHFETLEEKIRQGQGQLDFHSIAVNNVAVVDSVKPVKCDPSEKDILLQEISKYYQKGQSDYKCLACEADHCNFIGESAVRKHVVNVHPEKIFGDKKLPELTQEWFKFCCKKLLKMESKRALYKNPTDEKLRRFQLCPLCKAQNCDGHYLRHHLVVEHFQEMGEKLVQLQEQMVSTEATAITQITTPTPAICLTEHEDSTECPGKRKRGRPRKRKIAELEEDLDFDAEWTPTKPDLAICLRTTSRQKMCRDCGKKFSSSITLKSHRDGHCARNQNSGGKVWVCKGEGSGCGRVFDNFRGYRLHQIRSASCSTSRNGRTVNSEDPGITFDNEIVDTDDPLLEGGWYHPSQPIEIEETFEPPQEFDERMNQVPFMVQQNEENEEYVEQELLVPKCKLEVGSLEEISVCRGIPEETANFEGLMDCTVEDDWGQSENLLGGTAESREPVEIKASLSFNVMSNATDQENIFSAI